MNDTDHDSDTLSWSDIKARLDDIKAPAPAISGYVLQARYQLHDVLKHVATLRASDEKVVLSMRKVRWCIARIDDYLAASGLPKAFAPPRRTRFERIDDYEVAPSWRPRSSRRPRPSAP